MPEYTAHHNRITSNTELFTRVKVVLGGDETLTGEQSQLLDLTYRSFVRAGAELGEEEGTLQEEESDMIQSIFEFKEKRSGLLMPTSLASFCLLVLTALPNANDKFLFILAFIFAIFLCKTTICCVQL